VRPREARSSLQIDNITLVTGETIPVGRFTVVVGGNRTGKTTLLHEIHRAADEGAEGYRWVKSVKISDADPKASARLLIGSLEPHRHGATLQYRSRGIWKHRDANTAYDETLFNRFKALAESGAEPTLLRGRAQTSHPPSRR
jgi:ATPase subunit of ABC transporter with duplicated ATPase domains